MAIFVQTEDFDLSTEVAKLRATMPAVGAVVSFVGVVRDLNDGLDVHAMELEHYPGMTEMALEEIVALASLRWQLIDSVVIHRVGPLKPLDQIVLVAVATAHRGEAFAACEFIMDYLKTQAPFWKKEQTPEGERWVDARETDDAALVKWDAPVAPVQSQVAGQE
jgi:molybdopterin synthase catalytic subunit